MELGTTQNSKHLNSQYSYLQFFVLSERTFEFAIQERN